MMASKLIHSPAGTSLFHPGGFTLVEVVVAVFITSLLAVAIGQGTRAIFGSERLTEETWIATELGLSLIDEIVNLPFVDHEEPVEVIGADTDEYQDPWTREFFDDVDDYNVWDGSKLLQVKDGTRIEHAGWTRSVTVGYVLGSNFKTGSVSATSYKQITVNVHKDGQIVRSFSVVRGNGGRHVDYIN
jgi:prepilin-type N-terminal cleavage/methylation domain-containing protein